MIDDIPSGLGIQRSRGSSDGATPVARKSTLSKPSRGITKHVVNSTLHITVRVILSTSFGIKRVLVAVEATSIIALQVSIRSQSHSLSPNSKGILEVDAISPEIGTEYLDCGRGI
jgi:hypothetical protein